MRAKTEEEKKRAQRQMRRHWNRCERWGMLLDVSKMEINAHWSCCVKAANGDYDGVSQPPFDVVIAVRKAYSECLLRKAKGSKKLADWHYRRAREERQGRNSDEPDEIPDLEQRIKVMFWAIRTVGGVENARDALERAIKSLEGE